MIENFVDADKAANFLGIDRATVLRWARVGTIPGHPLGAGKRRVWRFRFSVRRFAAVMFLARFSPPFFPSRIAAGSFPFVAMLPLRNRTAYDGV